MKSNALEHLFYGERLDLDDRLLTLADAVPNLLFEFPLGSQFSSASLVLCEQCSRKIPRDADAHLPGENPTQMGAFWLRDLSCSHD
jgi:hypothetical protein